MRVSADVDERPLREIYLRGFQRVVDRGEALDPHVLLQQGQRHLRLAEPVAAHRRAARRVGLRGPRDVRLGRRRRPRRRAWPPVSTSRCRRARVAPTPRSSPPSATGGSTRAVLDVAVARVVDLVQKALRRDGHRRGAESGPRGLRRRGPPRARPRGGRAQRRAARERRHPAPRRQDASSRSSARSRRSRATRAPASRSSTRPASTPRSTACVSTPASAPCTYAAGFLLGDGTPRATADELAARGRRGGVRERRRRALPRPARRARVRGLRPRRHRARRPTSWRCSTRSSPRTPAPSSCCPTAASCASATRRTGRPPSSRAGCSARPAAAPWPTCSTAPSTRRAASRDDPATGSQDSPAYLDFPGEHGHVRYGEGIFVGYRWYDARDLEVSYPFGHGLSYTTFAYSDASASADADGPITVRVTVTNTGDRPDARSCRSTRRCRLGRRRAPRAS